MPDRPGADGVAETRASLGPGDPEATGLAADSDRTNEGAGPALRSAIPGSGALPVVPWSRAAASPGGGEPVGEPKPAGPCEVGSLPAPGDPASSGTAAPVPVAVVTAAPTSPPAGAPPGPREGPVPFPWVSVPDAGRAVGLATTTAGFPAMAPSATGRAALTGGGGMGVPTGPTGWSAPPSTKGGDDGLAGDGFSSGEVGLGRSFALLRSPVGEVAVPGSPGRAPTASGRTAGEGAAGTEAAPRIDAKPSSPCRSTPCWFDPPLPVSSAGADAGTGPMPPMTVKVFMWMLRRAGP